MTEDDLSAEENTRGLNINSEVPIWSDDYHRISSFISESDSNMEINLKKKNRSGWEADYLRRRRGSLNEKEIDEELWNENGFIDPAIVEERKNKEKELKIKQELDKQR